MPFVNGNNVEIIFFAHKNVCFDNSDKVISVRPIMFVIKTNRMHYFMLDHVHERTCSFLHHNLIILGIIILSNVGKAALIPTVH